MIDRLLLAITTFGTVFGALAAYDVLRRGDYVGFGILTFVSLLMAACAAEVLDDMLRSR